MISKNFCLGFLVFIQFKLTIGNFYDKRSEIKLQPTGKSVKQLVSQYNKELLQLVTIIF